jgi:hypothetical protein
MLRNIALSLAAASLALGAATLAPVTASANYSHCYEQPGAADCQHSTPAPTARRGAMHEQGTRTHRG